MENFCERGDVLLSFEFSQV